MIFLKSLTGGIISVIFTWVVLVAVYMWRVGQMNRQQGNNGLIAIGGGWDYLLHRPPVVVILAAAFGLGVYLTARWSSVAGV
jgi:hypothetical protein